MAPTIAGMSTIDPNRLTFMQGVLAALASTGQVIHYDELRRLCRLSREQVGEYLGEARRELIAAGQPDFCAVVVNDGGWPGDGWGDLASWPKHLRDAHNFWRDRRTFDNGDFQERHGALPAVPGLPR